MKRGVSKKKKPRDDLSSHRIREENVYSFQGTQVMGHDQSQEFKELLQYSETGSSPMTTIFLLNLSACGIVLCNTLVSFR